MRKVSKQLSFFAPTHDTLAEAAARVRDRLAEGSACPCCGQMAKAYTRTLNAPMARFLIWLVRAFEAQPRWYNIHEAPLIQGRRGGGDYGKLAHWGLIVLAASDTEEDQRTSGQWQPTAKGRRFVHGKVQVPAQVVLYDNRVLGWSEAWVSVEQALGKKFSYVDLMRSSEPL